jgi:predicted metal-binding membrane protein
MNTNTVMNLGDPPYPMKKAYWVAGLAAASAWVFLVFWSQSSFGHMMDHTTIGENTLSPITHLLVFLAGWTFMVIAMMLPIELHRNLSTGRARITLTYFLGYISIWMLFGILLYAGDSVLHELVENSPRMESLSWGFSAVLFLVAGIYQLSSLKQKCLQNGHGISAAGATWLARLSQGLKHGVICLGSCWGFMLIMFAVGQMSLLSMLLFFMLIAVENIIQIRRYITPALGIGMVLLGAIGLIIR